MDEIFPFFIKCADLSVSRRELKECSDYTNIQHEFKSQNKVIMLCTINKVCGKLSKQP
jgi:hypothetical protein